MVCAIQVKPVAEYIPSDNACVVMRDVFGSSVMQRNDPPQKMTFPFGGHFFSCGGHSTTARSGRWSLLYGMGSFLYIEKWPGSFLYVVKWPMGHFVGEGHFSALHRPGQSQ